MYHTNYFHVECFANGTKQILSLARVFPSMVSVSCNRSNVLSVGGHKYVAIVLWYKNATILKACRYTKFSLTHFHFTGVRNWV